VWSIFGWLASEFTGRAICVRLTAHGLILDSRSREELGAAAGTKRATSVVLLWYALITFGPMASSRSRLFHCLTNSSTPRKRPTPKAGEAPKPAPTQEEIDEWLSPLKECLKEVKELVSPGWLCLAYSR